FFSGRRSLFDFYSEPISRRLRGNDGSVTYHFDDLNYKMNCDLSAKDRLYLSYYTGNDDYNDLRVLQRSLSDTTSMVNDSEKVSWGNKLAALRWNHIFSDKIFGNTTFTFSTYRYASQDLVEVLLSTPADTLNRDIILQLYASRIKDISLKSDFDYAKFQKHKIKFGGHFTRHEFSTKIATYEEASKIDFIDRDTIGDFSNQPVLTNEMAFYIEDEIRFNPRVHANLGLRISSSQVQNSWFVLPQPRLLLNYMPDSVLSCHLSLSRMVQYLHLLSPSRLGLPKDLWVTSTRMAPPQDSWQVTLGLNRRLNKGFSINVDLYYKRLYHQLFFKGPIDRINTLNWQEQVSVGKGRSFGGELLLLRQGKKWSGWLGYTLSRSDRRFPADINFGERFPIKLDRRHNLNIQFLYHGFDKWDVSAGFIIASGSFYSLPSQEYTIRQFTGLPTSIDPVPIPEGVNDRKLATYHRFDVSANYYLKGRTANHVLKIGVTNLYNRLNPLFRTIRDKFNDNGVLSNEFVEVSLLPLFPSLRYVMDLH
ncbi:MAG TPA: TonB-dependent receptor, partial [Bacteroidetes bacterium]|nr:TonB-dependent receptor [Bacteroidota bacterium]